MPTFTKAPKPRSQWRYDEIVLLIEGLLQKRLKELLEDGHFYQKRSITLSEITSRVPLFVMHHRSDSKGIQMIEMAIAYSDLSGIEADNLKRDVEKALFSRWDIPNPLKGYISSRHVTEQGERNPSVTLPTINITCANCSASLPPHNSGHPLVSSFDILVDGQNALYSLVYLCQNCKSHPITFFVRRKGLKIELVGRSDFPSSVTPAELPQEKGLFQRADIAVKTGFTLAGVFYLRAFLEKYFRRVTGFGLVRATGDELADAYKKWLDTEVPDLSPQTPSLKKAYNDLSMTLHGGEEDKAALDQFEFTREEVVLHFESIALSKKLISKTRKG